MPVARKTGTAARRKQAPASPKSRTWSEDAISSLIADVDEVAENEPKSKAVSAAYVPARRTKPTRAAGRAEREKAAARVAEETSGPPGRRVIYTTGTDVKRAQEIDGAADAAWALNALYYDWRAAWKRETDPFNARLSLEWFDSREPQLPAAIAAAAAGGPGLAFLPGAAMWKPCRVAPSADDDEDAVRSVTVDGGDGPEPFHPLFVCVAADAAGRRVAADRLHGALTRRAEAEALLRADLYSSSMPVDAAIVGRLGESTAGRILDLALSASGTAGDVSATELLSEVERLYERCMNSIIFTSNMLDRSNVSAYSELELPPPPTPPPVPYIGVVPTGAAVGLTADKLRLLPPPAADAGANEPKSTTTPGEAGPGGSDEAPKLAASSSPKGAEAKSSYAANGKVFQSATYMSHVQAYRAMDAARGTCLGVKETRVFATAPMGESLTPSGFSRRQASALNAAVRILRDDWPNRAAGLMRTALQAAARAGSAGSPPPSPTGAGLPSSGDVADAAAAYSLDAPMSEYTQEGNPLRRLLARANLMMTDTLRDVTVASLDEYCAAVSKCAEASVVVRSPMAVDVTWPAVPLAHRTPRGPPLFAVALRVTAEPGTLNQEAIDAGEAAIAEWKASEAGQEEGAECPLSSVEPVVGLSFEYDVPKGETQRVVLDGFDRALSDLHQVPHLQRFVMERLFWPRPLMVGSVSEDEASIVDLRAKLAEAVAEASVPLDRYLATLNQHLKFLNLDIEAYLAEQHIVEPNESGSVDEPPLVVKTETLKAKLTYHRDERQKLLDGLPTDALDCGLHAVDVSGLRTLLADKHKTISERLLSAHADNCMSVSSFITVKFSEVMVRLQRKPHNIEEASELEEVLESVEDTLKPFQDVIDQLKEYYSVMDEFGFRVAQPIADAQWAAAHWPLKIHFQCDESTRVIEQCRDRYLEDMLAEQDEFGRSLVALEQLVSALDQYDDLSQVGPAAAKIADCAQRIATADEKAKLFNSREGLFDKEATDYTVLSTIKKTFDPFSNLWKTASLWINNQRAWMHGAFLDLDAEKLEDQVESQLTLVGKAAKFFERDEASAKQAKIATDIRGQIQAFRPNVPLITALRNQGMRDRHWAQLSKELGFTISPDESLTLTHLLDLSPLEHLESIQKISEAAAKEFGIEQVLDKMVGEWENMNLEIKSYRDTGSGVLKGSDEIMNVLDEHVTMTQAMQFSSFKGPFEQRIDDWDRKLYMVSEVLEAWLAVQRSWMYLQPIFESDDINKQLPAEGKKFATVDKNWKQTISSAKSTPKAIDFCDNEKLLDRFKTGAALLDQVQKGLNDYLESKRVVFARFYFLSNDDLLSILSESKDPTRIQPHLKKCFDAIDRVVFEGDENLIMTMISPETETVDFTTPVVTLHQNVENWMLVVEAEMQQTLKNTMRDSINDYVTTPRPQWMQNWCSMCVLNGSQMHWTTEMEERFTRLGAAGPADMLELQKAQLADMIILVRGELGKSARTTVGALTVIDVHARDVMTKLITAKAVDANHFGWQSQLRYYFHEDENQLWVHQVAAKRAYGYEYLGNSFRLVITPLTDKCYLTLMGALQEILGGAPAGPAGTGKTETTKDLAKALAQYCVVFNCGDGIDYLMMAKFFKGLANCGAWACFDEFNRINIEVLSVIGQQIMEIQNALRSSTPSITFEGSEVKVLPGFGVFITMNPGYAGRTELPDSLAALFRPVAMMVPDYALIGEIMFLAYGFEFGRECGQKMVTTFKLCSEQCSSQPHYDYGMRAVKTVITAAGNLKRASPQQDEMVLLLRALQDVNIPKFLDGDIPLFAGIISDLFPGKKRPELDYGLMLKYMKDVIEDRVLQPHAWFISKVIQLYEMIVVRHGLMVVGPAGGGKTSNVDVLKDTLAKLKANNVEGFAFEKVVVYQLNPKSITMGQMYGAFDESTREWQDGIMSVMYRKASSSESKDRKWMMFNGPVDAIWIESMNTVLDDNKKLCLVSGETIKMSDEMTMMFEVEDLAVASPATVSRVGIIFMEPKALGIDVLVQSWLSKRPACVKEGVSTKLRVLFELYVSKALWFSRSSIKELVPTMANNLAESLMRILGDFFEPYEEKEGRDLPSADECAKFATEIEALFIFSLVWSLGGTGNEASRHKFDVWLRAEMKANSAEFLFPKSGYVYDYTWDPATSKWKGWMDTIDPFKVNNKLSFSEMVVPTLDSVRSTALLDHLAMRGHHVLMVGETGTGKTINISQYLQGQSASAGRVVGPNSIPFTLTFSAQTSANMTQDMLDAKMDKRKRGVFGPPSGKNYLIHVDDLNMPKVEEYGAQPPIEILRQWFDQGGWYDRSGDLAFRKIVDATFIASMGPPGGGRNDITPRFIRHFNVIGYNELSDASKGVVFTAIFGDWLNQFSAAHGKLLEPIIGATTAIFNNIQAALLPTPTKCHYTYNLRDMAKVFQGILMAAPKGVTEGGPVQLARLWVHECKRVFEDRLVTVEDHQWFVEQMQGQVTTALGMEWDEVVPVERLMYGDFMDAHADPRLYNELPELSEVKKCIEEYLVEHNSESKSPMPLVMFSDAIEHVVRMARVLRTPGGNGLLLGVGGSGRQSMTKLASYVAGYTVRQVEISKGYGMVEWREDLRQILLLAGIKNKPVTFLYSDVQIIDETMLEDINNVLNAGDVPNIYGPEEIDQILTTCRADCQRKRIQPTKLNIFAQYIGRVRKNLHVCLCMSPIGEVFRNRLRQFPSLVNCSTIDWYTPWPAEALESVATAALTKVDLKLGDTIGSIVKMFKTIHQTSEAGAEKFWDVLRRRLYVTPTSYLELLSAFQTLLGFKREEVNTMRDRLSIGLDKLKTTREQVDGMKATLEELQPKLVSKGKEVGEMMIVITRDKAEAEETKSKVTVIEENASAKAAECKLIADDAQKDLDKAIPALEAAVQCLKDLSKKDIDEVKALQKPPNGVKLAMEVCCHYFEVPPIKEKDPDDPTKKVNNYFLASKKTLLSDSGKFMTQLQEYDKDHIPDKVIRKVAPYMENPDFTPEQIKRASTACHALCLWARAMHTYHFVALGVAPKRAKLKGASEELAVAQGTLADANAKLKAVVDRLAVLEKNFNSAVDEKDSLEKQHSQCQTQLSNAEKLLGGLGGEAARWSDTVQELNLTYTNLTGDLLVAAGTISYLGAFTYEFRTNVTAEWHAKLAEYKLPHSLGCDIESSLVQPVKLRAWQLAGLPTDPLSTQNGIMMDKGRRWSLLIDPQGQANRYIKNLAKDKEFAENGMDAVKQTDKNMLRALENGIRFGKWVLLENINENLDAALEPILLQQKFKQAGQEVIKLGDNTVPYNDSFRFFLTTRLPNPHYSPETQVKVQLINFTVTIGGLEDQLLGITVEQEMPELAEKKSEMVIENAAMTKQLYDIESEILKQLANSTGNILDDTVLIETLAQAKATSEEVKAKMAEAEITSAQLFQTSEGYRPAAKRASVLYFCLADMANVDPMYQYALPWFANMFVKGINTAPKSNELAQRLTNLNDHFTYMLYANVCRSLFEKDKLLFSFLLCVKILQADGDIDPIEWRFLISGVSPGGVDSPNPDSDWISADVWGSIQQLAGLEAFKTFPADFGDNLAKWKRVFDSMEPHTTTFPAPYSQLGASIRRMCVLRCLRRDKIMEAMAEFVKSQMGVRFIEPPAFNLKDCYNDSLVTTPLIFVLSTGSDPNKDLNILAEDMDMADRLKSIALGQGQGALAARMIERGVVAGDWVLLQNCHLCVSWMPDLDAIHEDFVADRMHPDFRLWLTSKPSSAFPVPVLQNGVKMTKEPPRGLKANLQAIYLKLDDAALSPANKPHEYRKLLFGLCFFHAVMIERKKFGPLGWNVGYGYNDTDLDICQAQLKMYLDKYDEVPYSVLQQLTSVVNYGGRITDDKDMRTADVIVKDFMTPNILSDNYKFSRSGRYFSISADPDAPHSSYLDYIASLPHMPEPEIFGMHDNAAITVLINEADDNMAVITSLQPRVSGGAGASREDQIAEKASEMQKRLPVSWDLEAVFMKYPTSYTQCLNTTLTQETTRFIALIDGMTSTLKSLQLALRGLVVLSSELESMGSSMYDTTVPLVWEKKAYPSLKPLNSWFEDFLRRIKFVDDWIEIGMPPVFWISGFYFPQGFLTANLQNHARKYDMPVDTVAFGFAMRAEAAEELMARPEDGCYIDGMFIEGARFDKRKGSLVDPRPKELFSPMPVIHMLPIQHRKAPTSGVYRTPLYKLLTRKGALSTTGHSTNFVCWLEIPSNKPTIFRTALVSETNAQVQLCDNDYWIKAGVAAFCALRY